MLGTGPPAWQRFIAEQCISSRVLMCLKWNHGMLEFWDISMQGNWVHACMFQMNSVSLCEIHGTSDVNSNVRSMKADYSKFIVHCYYSMHASISTAANVFPVIFLDDFIKRIILSSSQLVAASISITISLTIIEVHNQCQKRIRNSRNLTGHFQFILQTWPQASSSIHQILMYWIRKFAVVGIN